ncbi:Proline iminopeptidase [Penicillium angulare]|uniref:Proline iminopeptidase n=1 Tax=Penicillium angulare TaxID=116970 RepID=UPI00254149BB|nr:Proline iminopeptidase [Penicillium angulare]KAJ5281190.1 Proline iminopeptidase [Penicillium angulare]
MAGYMHTDPFDTGTLAVGTIHHLYYEQYGNPDGKPVIFLHGGPGGKTSKNNTTYFNPSIYRVILLDQRGTGKSQPQTELRENTTPDLVTDIETLRIHLQIPKWHLLFGGSWGSTLALLYAQSHPDKVNALLLRGVFTTRDAEVSWSRGALGAANIFPEAWEVFLSFLPVQERGDPVAAYYKRLTGDDYAVRLAAAKEWNRWDMSIGSLRVDESGFLALEDEEWSLAHALMEAHYAVHHFWLDEGQILKSENLERMRHLSVTIVQGRYDMMLDIVGRYVYNEVVVGNLGRGLNY